MRFRTLALLAALAMAAATACQATPPPLEELTTPVPTKAPPAPASTVAGAAVPEASPSPRPTPFAFLRFGTPVPTAPTPTPSGPTATPTRSGPTATPTPTVEPTPNPQLVKAANDVLGKVDDLVASIRDRDNPRALVLQRELLEQLDRIEKAAKADRSKFGGQLLDLGRELRNSATGDVSKLNVVRSQLAQLVGRAGANARPIADVVSYAGQLAGKVAEFRKAFEDGNTARLLSLQSELLSEVDRADAEFKDSRSQVADRLRSALDDLRNGFGGDQNRLRSAEAKLRQIAGTGQADIARTQPTATPRPTNTPSPDVRPFANELSNRLGQYVQALRQNDPTVLAKAKADLTDEIALAEAKLRGDRSDPANELRAAMTLLRELLAGDLTKVADARAALDQAKLQ